MNFHARLHFIKNQYPLVEGNDVLDFFTELTILKVCMCLYFLCHIQWPEVSVILY